MSKYEWKVVTQECEVELQSGYDNTWINVGHDGDRIAVVSDAGIVLQGDEDYRLDIDDDRDFRIERRVEVEKPKPKEVRITVTSDAAWRTKTLGSKLISYRSAVELGLIKEDSDE